MDALSRGASDLLKMSIDKRVALVEQCIEGTAAAAHQWVETACEAKRIEKGNPARTEEVASGPLATIRFLQLLSQTLQDVKATGAPRLPAKVQQRHGQCRVRVFPTRQLYDSIFFRPMAAETWLGSDVDPDNVSALGTARVLGHGRQQEIIVVLGAGNVAAIPITDALTKIFIENSTVALKMNPVNDYLGPFFEQALRPLIDAKLLRLAYGGIDTGKHLINHPAMTGVHITGSIHSHDNIVWGGDDRREQRRSEDTPVLQKKITSELGNVSPWAIIPGHYSEKQLLAQAELIAASITNNVSFNCIATKMILTCRDWPQRQRFWEHVNNVLSKTPTRYAYYPGAAQRYQRFSGIEPDNPERLPFTILPDIDAVQSPHLLQDESFTPVCAELVLNADSVVAFMHQAVDVMNDQVWGTLAASLTVPKDFETKHAASLDECLRKLRFGTIGINQWPALSFALMSPPWGGYPSGSLQDAQSGIGFVHNTYLLDCPEKTILRAPLRISPKPIWVSTHRHPEKVAWDLLKLYAQPSVWRLPPVFLSALTG